MKSKTFLPTIAVFLFFLFFLYKKTVITLARSILAVDKAHSLVSVFSVLKGLLQKSVKLVKLANRDQPHVHFVVLENGQKIELNV